MFEPSIVSAWASEYHGAIPFCAVFTMYVRVLLGVLLVAATIWIALALLWPDRRLRGFTPARASRCARSGE